MSVHLGFNCPNFRPCVTSDGEFDSFYEFLDFRERERLEDDLPPFEWTILSTHPAAFTCVCTSELIEYYVLLPYFIKLNCQLLVFAPSGIDDMRLWMQDVVGFADETKGQSRNPNGKNQATTTSTVPVLNADGTREFPKLPSNLALIADPTRSVCVHLGILNPYADLHLSGTAKQNAAPPSVRGLFILNKNRTVQLIKHYPITVGRDGVELFRSLEALEVTRNVCKNDLATPASWKPQDSYMLVMPHINIEEVKKNGHLKLIRSPVAVASGLRYMTLCEMPKRPLYKMWQTKPKSDVTDISVIQPKKHGQRENDNGETPQSPGMSSAGLGLYANDMDKVTVRGPASGPCYPPPSRMIQNYTPSPGSLDPGPIPPAAPIQQQVNSASALNPDSGLSPSHMSDPYAKAYEGSSPSLNNSLADINNLQHGGQPAHLQTYSRNQHRRHFQDMEAMTEGERIRFDHYRKHGMKISTSEIGGDGTWKEFKDKKKKEKN